MTTKGKAGDEKAETAEATAKKATGQVERLKKERQSFTFRADFFQVTMSAEAKDKLPSMPAPKRHDFLVRRMRLIPEKTEDGAAHETPRGSVGHWFDADLKAIERTIDGGALVGSRGPTLHESVVKADGKKGDE